MILTMSATALLLACQYAARPELLRYYETTPRSERGTRFHSAIETFVTFGERENVAELEERLVLCQRTNDRMREQLGHKPPPWKMNK